MLPADRDIPDFLAEDDDLDDLDEAGEGGDDNDDMAFLQSILGHEGNWQDGREEEERGGGTHKSGYYEKAQALYNVGGSYTTKQLHGLTDPEAALLIVSQTMSVIKKEVSIVHRLQQWREGCDGRFGQAPHWGLRACENLLLRVFSRLVLRR